MVFFVLFTKCGQAYLSSRNSTKYYFLEKTEPK